MKRFAFILAALLLFAACTKEEPSPEPQPRPTAAISLAGTSWVGGFDGDSQGYPLTFTWRFDFLTDSTGEYHLDCVFAANQQPTQDGTFRYTFDGTDGTVLPDGHNPLPFVYDSAQQTISMEIIMQVGSGSMSTTLGGTTVFRPLGQEIPAFPVNTSWTAEQQLPSGDTLMPVHWGLDFWEYGWGGQVNYCAGSTCAGVSLFWRYDSAAHSGTIAINGTQHPFIYDPATDILTLEYTTEVYGTTVPIGGTLQFHRSKEPDSNTTCKVVVMK